MMTIGIAQDNSGKLVSQVRNRAKEMAVKNSQNQNSNFSKDQEHIR